MPKGGTHLFCHDLAVIMKARKKIVRLELTQNCEFK